MEFERAGRGVWGGQGRWSLREQGGVFGGAKGGGV